MTLAEKEQVLTMLTGGESYSGTARTLGLTYQQVYQLALRAGIAAVRAEEHRARQAEKEQRRLADEMRHRSLLDAYRRGELATDGNPAAQVYEALLIHPAFDRGGVPDLEELESLAYLLRDEAK